MCIRDRYLLVVDQLTCRYLLAQLSHRLFVYLCEPVSYTHLDVYKRQVARRPLPSLHVKYANEPEKLSLEMVDFLHASEGNLPSNKADI